MSQKDSSKVGLMGQHGIVPRLTCSGIAEDARSELYLGAPQFTLARGCPLTPSNHNNTKKSLPIGDHHHFRLVHPSSPSSALLTSPQVIKMPVKAEDTTTGTLHSVNKSAASQQPILGAGGKALPAPYK
jgi:hypothetical protein